MTLNYYSILNLEHQLPRVYPPFPLPPFHLTLFGIIFLDDLCHQLVGLLSGFGVLGKIMGLLQKSVLVLLI